MVRGTSKTASFNCRVKNICWGSAARYQVKEMHTRRFYKIDKMITLLVAGESVSLFQVKAACLATLSGKKCTMVVSDAKHTGLAFLCNRTLDIHTYLPFGYSAQALIHPLRPGYNGEWLCSASGGYLLGNGHRVFKPQRMGFESPDALSPFGAGGINAYTNCQGDPLNYVDPSGQFRIGRLKFSNLFRWPFRKRVRVSDRQVSKGVAAVTKALVGGSEQQKASLRKLSEDRRAFNELSNEVLALGSTAFGISWRGSDYRGIITDIVVEPFYWQQRKFSYAHQISLLEDRKAFLTAFVGAGPDQDLIPLAQAVSASQALIRSGGQRPPARHPQ